MHSNKFADVAVTRARSETLATQDKSAIENRLFQTSN